MEQLVKVITTREDGMAQVMHVRQSACSGDCHNCSGCGAVEQKLLLEAYNAIGAVAGDMVTISTPSKPVLTAAAVLYMMPLVLFFAGYLLGQQLWSLGGLVGCLAFVTGLVLAVVYDRCVVKKRKTVYTITGFAGNGTES